MRRGSKELEVRRLVCAALVERNTVDHMRVLDRLRWLPALLRSDTPFAGLTPAQTSALMDRYSPSNARVAREYGVNSDGVLFADNAVKHCSSSSHVCWSDIPENERNLTRRYILERTGVDIDPGAPGTVIGRQAVAACIALHCLRRIAQLPGQWRRFIELRDPRLVAGWLREFLAASNQDP